MAGDLAGGCWVEPTIWTGLPETPPSCARRSSARAATSRPFDTEEEAIRLANDTRLRPRRRRCGPRTCRAPIGSRRGSRSGICWVNSWFLRDLRTPFGGAKQSGIGREGGVHSLEFYTELTNVCIEI